MTTRFLRLASKSAVRVLPLLLAAAGCAVEPMRRDEVVGRYVMHRDGGASALVLRPGGRWVQRVTSAAGSLRVDSGAWQLQNEEGEDRLVLYDFTLYPLSDREARYLPDHPVTWSVPIGRTRRGMQVTMQADVGLYYVKVRGDSDRAQPPGPD